MIRGERANHTTSFNTYVQDSLGVQLVQRLHQDPEAQEHLVVPVIRKGVVKF